MTIMATRIVPVRHLTSEEHICRRCGIEFTGRNNAIHCRDCRSLLRPSNQPSTKEAKA